MRAENRIAKKKQRNRRKICEVDYIVLHVCINLHHFICLLLLEGSLVDLGYPLNPHLSIYLRVLLLHFLACPQKAKSLFFCHFEGVLHQSWSHGVLPHILYEHEERGNKYE